MIRLNYAGDALFAFRLRDKVSVNETLAGYFYHFVERGNILFPKSKGTVNFAKPRLSIILIEDRFKEPRNFYRWIAKVKCQRPTN